MVSAALQVALQLKIADQVAKGPRPVADLARTTQVDEDALYRTLRALSSVGIFEETTPRTFASTPAAELCRSDAPGLYPLLVFLTDPMHFRVYAELIHSVQTGRPAGDKVLGMPVFQYFEKNPAHSEIFNNAMTSFSAMVVPATLKAYDFSGIETLVDVAGGHGHVLMSILREYPRMRGVLFDIDHVIAGAVPKIAAAGLQDRMTTQAGDFFKSVPEGGDAYIMKHIIHDWNDDQATVILRNIARMLKGKPRGRVILLEAVIQPDNQADLAKLVDLEMLVFPGGRERTESDFATLFAGAGFELTRVVPTESPLSVIEGRLRG
jgi:hypothetical protein